jgi:hypothetical protein
MRGLVAKFGDEGPQAFRVGAELVAAGLDLRSENAHDSIRRLKTIFRAPSSPMSSVARMADHKS